jgi:hypothetical protein
LNFDLRTFKDQSMPSTPYESADLLLRLYELRREATMREARNWFAREFNPDTIDDVVQALMGPNSGHFRMVTSYWDMAASFVLNGAIDEQMFNDANGEQIGVFAKMEPFLSEYRNRMGNPRSLSQLEQIVMRRPGAKEQLAAIREWFKTRATATK